MDEENAEKCALNFAQEFFNFEYNGALKDCAQGSDKWLRMYVSNISQADIDSIQNITVRPKISIDKVERGENDSVATAFCIVKDVCVLDTIGKPCHIIKRGILKIQLIRENSHWKVKMVDLLQNVK